ncbi:hypothetical protein NDU88_006690 [Pleurodeles waltl]|uniref:Uncharacterized protein n=1 Tax=Pleurodeles waltl TaxID=8319 RepID=A0AAV7PJG8_PLEWA|nr:hypothetical protein NDU88_006690 [Pleurodeles waltl]
MKALSQADKCGAPTEERATAQTDLGLPARKEPHSILRQPCDWAVDEPEYEDPPPRKGSTDDPGFRRSASKELKTEAHCGNEVAFDPVSGRNAVIWRKDTRQRRLPRELPGPR